MFQIAPIDKAFVPYSSRPVRNNNAGLFVRRGKRGGGTKTVALQSGIQCQARCQSCGPNGAVCYGPGGPCLSPGDPLAPNCG